MTHSAHVSGQSWICIPLMFTMLVTVLSVHWQNGWLAIAEGAESLFANERTIAAVQRLEEAREILKQQADYQWLTEHGSLVVLNNGIEFSVSYFITLLVLFLSVRDAISPSITGCIVV